MMLEIRGILNLLVATGTLLANICPFCIWHWGIVGEIRG